MQVSPTAPFTAAAAGYQAAMEQLVPGARYDAGLASLRQANESLRAGLTVLEATKASADLLSQFDNAAARGRYVEALAAVYAGLGDEVDELTAMVATTYLPAAIEAATAGANVIASMTAAA